MATDVAYDVVSEDVGTDGDSVFYSVISSSSDLESLNLVAQEIQQGRLRHNSGAISFYETRADVPGGEPVGAAVMYLGEMQVRNEYSQNAGADLPPEEVEQIVDVLAENGYVYTYVLPGGEGIPVLPDSMI